ncbi:MAG: 50S ribosomal protein L9 [Clostridiales bacterium]|nr:50S ribosomal protein L9 [Clostridiales bacterium]
MKVILLQDVKSLGKRGEIKEVADGYARNFLLPKKLVQQANAGNLNSIQHEKNLQVKRDANALAKAQEFAAQLAQKQLTVTAKCGESGRLFGSVTSNDLAEALAAQGVTVDKRKIDLLEPVKTLGSYEADIKLHAEVHCKIAFEVIKEE